MRKITGHAHKVLLRGHVMAWRWAGQGSIRSHLSGPCLLFRKLGFSRYIRSSNVPGLLFADRVTGPSPSCCSPRLRVTSSRPHWAFLPLSLIHLPVLLRSAGFPPPCRAQHLVAASGDLVHPHDVHDVQADAGADPGDAASPGHQVEGVGAVDWVHTTVVHWHDGDADKEKDHCHGDTIHHVGPGRFGVT